MLTCVLGDPIVAREFPHGIRVRPLIPLESPHVIGSHFPSLQANKHIHYLFLQRPNTLLLLTDTSNVLPVPSLFEIERRRRRRGMCIFGVSQARTIVFYAPVISLDFSRISHV